jgi:hypothetical protein
MSTWFRHLTLLVDLMLYLFVGLSLVFIVTISATSLRLLSLAEMKELAFVGFVAGPIAGAGAWCK